MKKKPTHSDNKFLNYLKSQGKKEIIKPTKSALEVWSNSKNDEPSVV